MRLGFGEYQLDTDTRQLFRNRQPAPLSPKAFLLLEALLGARPKALSKAEIQRVIWPSTFVSETNLGNLILEIRRALGDDVQRPHFIRTVPRFGYAFCGEAGPTSEPAPTTSPSEGPVYRLIWGRREIALDLGENLIGRDRHAVVWIDDASVSRRHARVRVDDEGATLEDLGSKNGTYLRGKRLGTAARLCDRDRLKIGPASMVFRVLRRTGSTLSHTAERGPR